MPSFEALVGLLADGKFHSGEVLGRALGVSRAAVWNSLRDVARYGISVDAVQGRGYRLKTPLELLELSAIEGAMAREVRNSLGPIELLFEVDSTNQYLQRHSGRVAHGAVCFAECQSAGRGRRGRRWISPLGANIYLSILWRFSDGPAKLGGLSLALAVAAVRALEKVGASGVHVKWPNDLLWNGKKLGGILLEVTGESNGPCEVVAGVGINVGMPVGAPIDQPWADLRQIVPDTSRNNVAGTLLEEIASMMRHFEQAGFESVRDAWLRYDGFAGREVTLHSPKSIITGIARGVDSGGHLLLETRSGIQHFASGEVSLRGE